MRHRHGLGPARACRSCHRHHRSCRRSMGRWVARRRRRRRGSAARPTQCQRQRPEPRPSLPSQGQRAVFRWLEAPQFKQGGFHRHHARPRFQGLIAGGVDRDLTDSSDGGFPWREYLSCLDDEGEQATGPGVERFLFKFLLAPARADFVVQRVDGVDVRLNPGSNRVKKVEPIFGELQNWLPGP